MLKLSLYFIYFWWFLYLPLFLDVFWPSSSLSLHLSEEKLLCKFSENFSAKRLYKIENLYSKWFDHSTKWKKQESKPLEEFSFTWPVYDLEIAGSTLVTVSGKFCFVFFFYFFIDFFVFFFLDCLRVFDLSKNKSTAVLAGHTKVVNSVNLTKTGKACVTGSVDKTVKLWSLVTKECLNTFEGHSGPITDVLQTTDFVISSCVQDNSVRFWEKK